MRVCDITEADSVSCAARITIRAVDAAEHTDPIVEYDIDLGTPAAKALQEQDWAQLGRLQPPGKRSKDPARVQGAKTRRTAAPNAGVPPIEGGGTTPQ